MAAGLGFKTFNTGDVLSAADTNGYLMQGVLVFASAAARDAAITSPQEGQFAYLKDTNVTTYYTGSAWANLDTTGMTNPMTTTGDTIYSSSGSTPARLGIGTAGQVLTVAGGVPSWATAGGAGKDFSLLNAGGTALTGAATITVSGISAKDSILVFVDGASSTNANSAISIRLNTDTTSKYWQAGNYMGIGSTYSTNFAGGSEGYYTPTGDTRIGLGNMGADTTHVVTGAAIFQGCNSTGGKVFNVNGGVSYLNATPIMFNTSGVYTGTSTISSISLFTNAGTFDAGTVYVYASA